MSDRPQQPKREKLLVNLGSGAEGVTLLPPLFAGWRQMRVDADAAALPDLVADITDLSAIESGAADVVWAAHCFEHLYLHQVAQAASECYRILADDGFLCVIVPDLQVIAEYITGDRMEEAVYRAPAGAVTAHDMIYGFGGYLARGQEHMGHRCGFTPNLLARKLQQAPFAEIVLKRRPNHELVAVACRRRPAGDDERNALLASLQL